MRVALLIDRWEPARGGAERALAALARHLSDAGDDVHAYGLRAADGAPGTFHAVDLPRLPRGRLERELALRSLDLAAADGCDRTISIRHAPRSDVYWPHGGLHRETLAAGERARGGIAGPVARLLHTTSPRHRAFLALEEEMLAGGAGRVWAVSSLVAREVADAYPSAAGRVELHGNGVDRERFAPVPPDRRAAARRVLGVDDAGPVIVFPGGNWRLKGLAILLDALHLATDRPWTCVAAGARPDVVTRAVARLPLVGRVLGLPPQDPRDLLAAADLLVQPSFRDPCSLATLEALASGVPVVTTTANGAAEAVSTDCGAVVPPGDVLALAAALREWLVRVTDPETRGDAADAARSATDTRDRAAWLAGLRESLGRLSP